MKKKSANDFICFLSLLSLVHANVTSTEITPTAVVSVQQLAKTGGSCKSQGLCKGRTGDRLRAPENMSEITLMGISCFCDDECHLFGECCADLATGGSADSGEHQSNTTTVIPEDGGVKLFQGIPTSQWGCYSLNLYSMYSAYLVDKCPDYYWDEEAITKCSKRHLVPDKDYNYILDLPVVSSTTGVPYLNSYCLACNEEMLLTSPFFPVTLKLLCSNETLRADRIHSEDSYVKGDRFWMDEDGNCTLVLVDARKIFYGDSRHPDPHRPGRYTRRCQPRESSCEDDDLAELCASYALFVKSKETKPRIGLKPTIYKNPHCALCNGIQMEDIVCGSSMIQVLGGKRLYTLPSFTLFEIRWDGGTLGSDSHQCPSHHVWDVMQKKCSLVNCKDGMMFVNGSCQDNFGHGNKSSLEDATCSGNSSGTDPECSASEEEEKDIHRKIQGYLMLVCISLSVFCLILHIAIYSTLPKLRNLPGKNLLALSWALMLAQGIALGSGFLQNRNQYEFWCCKIVGMIVHFFYLSAIFWMNVMSIDVWRTFSSSSSHRHLFGRHESAKRLHMWYAVYAWGGPMILVLITISVEFAPSETPSMEYIRPIYGATREGICWLSNHIAVLIFFVFPTCGLLIANATLFAISVYRIHANQESRRYMRKRAREEESLCSERLSKVASRESSDIPSAIVSRREHRQSTNTTSCISVKDKSRLYLYVKLGIIMGLTWVCAFIAGSTKIKELWYPFIVLNGLQGAFIFFMFDVKKKVLEMLWEKVTGKKPEWASTSSKFSTWAFFTNTKRERRRRKSSENQSKSTTDSSNKRNSSSGARTSLSAVPAFGCSDDQDQPSPRPGTMDIEEVRLENMLDTSTNGIALSPNFFTDSEATFSFCGTRPEVVTERGKVEGISEERDTSLNFIREEDEP